MTPSPPAFTAEALLTGAVVGTPDSPWSYDLNLTYQAAAPDGAAGSYSLDLPALAIRDTDWRRLGGRSFHGLNTQGRNDTHLGYLEGLLRVDTLSFTAWSGVTSRFNCEVTLLQGNDPAGAVLVFEGPVRFCGVRVSVDGWRWQPDAAQNAAIAQAEQLNRRASKAAWQRLRNLDAWALLSRTHDVSAYGRPDFERRHMLLPPA